jgi:hypothetical protein
MTARILLALLLAVLHGPGLTLAQEFPEVQTSENAANVGEESANPNPPRQLTDEQREQKRQLEIGMILVGGILILGIFLLALTLLVSRRVKRTASHGRQPSQPRDELWYLKHAPADQSSESEEPSE